MSSKHLEYPPTIIQFELLFKLVESIYGLSGLSLLGTVYIDRMSKFKI